MSAFRESDARGRLPLHAAAVQPQQDVLHAVLQGARTEELLGKSKFGTSLTADDVGAAVTSSGLTLEEQTEDGDTPLTLAAEAGLEGNVRMLLQHGASPHSTNSRNEPPLLIGNTNNSSSLINIFH